MGGPGGGAAQVPGAGPPGAGLAGAGAGWAGAGAGFAGAGAGLAGAGAGLAGAGAGAGLPDPGLLDPPPVDPPPYDSPPPEPQPLDALAAAIKKAEATKDFAKRIMNVRNQMSVVKLTRQGRKEMGARMVILYQESAEKKSPVRWQSFNNSVTHRAKDVDPILACVFVAFRVSIGSGHVHSEANPSLKGTQPDEMGSMR